MDRLPISTHNTYRVLYFLIILGTDPPSTKRISCFVFMFGCIRKDGLYAKALSFLL